ncbi:hypothetical protein VVR12_01685 [Rothia sp. LK2588]|uniref:hypothetical protein n=1 Tax=Rothia sp. LK2588 TaxID=3114369 RepID=UPI0034CD2595
MNDVTNRSMPPELNAFDFHICSQFGKVTGYRLVEDAQMGLYTYEILLTNCKTIRYIKDNQVAAVAEPNEENN